MKALSKKEYKGCFKSKKMYIFHLHQKSTTAIFQKSYQDTRRFACEGSNMLSTSRTTN